MQQLRHDHDAILTGIGTVLADDCLLTDRTGLPRSRPLLRIVLDSQLRLPLDSKMVRSAAGDVLVVTTSAASRRTPQGAGSPRHRGAGLGRAAAAAPILRGVVELAGASNATFPLMIEAGSKVNWTALETGVVDRVFFYYAPKILGGLEVAAAGRRHRPAPPRRRHPRPRRHDPPHSARTSSPSKDTVGMFTGIIEELGDGGIDRRAGARLRVRCATVLEDMTVGASIAVNGVCLTAVDLQPGFLRRRPGAGNPAPQQSGRSAGRARA